MGYSPLTRRTAWTDKYGSREGRRVEMLIVHHTAGGSNQGNLTHLSGSRWRNEISAHYLLTTDLDFIGIVDETHRAWTTGNREADQRGVTVETVNTTGAPGWRVSPRQVERLAEMAVDLCRRYGWGSLHRGNVRMHREFYNTACPGPYLVARIDEIIRRGNELLNASHKQVTATGPLPKSRHVLAAEVRAGKYGAGEARKKALGDRYFFVQHTVNFQHYGLDDCPLDSLVWLTRLGDFGNGLERQRRLGHRYAEVRSEMARYRANGTFAKYGL